MRDPCDRHAVRAELNVVHVLAELVDPASLDSIEGDRDLLGSAADDLALVTLGEREREVAGGLCIQDTGGGALGSAHEVAVDARASVRDLFEGERGPEVGELL